MPQLSITSLSQRPGRILALGGLALLCLTLPLRTWAAALDPESCAKLKTQQEEMEKAGLKDIVARGPEWAKANLPPDRINDIKRWIDVDEQLLFRCPGRHLVNLPLEPDPPPPPPPAEDKKPEGEKVEAPATAPKSAPPAEKKAATGEKKAPEKKPAAQPKRPATKEKTNPETGDEPDAKAGAKVKPTAKQKARDDAYKPAPGDPLNPFGVN